MYIYMYNINMEFFKLPLTPPTINLLNTLYTCLLACFTPHISAYTLQGNSLCLLREAITPARVNIIQPQANI